MDTNKSTKSTSNTSNNVCAKCNTNLKNKKHECKECYMCKRYTPNVYVTDGYIYWKCYPKWNDCSDKHNNNNYYNYNSDSEEILSSENECDCYDYGAQRCLCFKNN